MSDPIHTIRRFNRAVTREAGVLDDSFLGRGRPLGAARVLNAIGQGYADVAALRDYLDLDSGLLSRLLRGLEAEALITTHPAPDDARRRVAMLTPKGHEEFEAYEALSNTRAQGLLSRHPRADDLLAAMELVANALSADAIDIEQVDPVGEVALTCLHQYYRELAARFDQGYDPALAADPTPQAMRPPRGTFLVATCDGAALGCVGLKDAGDYAEIKRLWITPSARRLGLAKRLMEGAENSARVLGHALLRLDTNSKLPEAAALYRRLGWAEIERFNDDPYPDQFFEKRL